MRLTRIRDKTFFFYPPTQPLLPFLTSDDDELLCFVSVYSHICSTTLSAAERESVSQNDCAALVFRIKDDSRG